MRKTKIYDKVMPLSPVEELLKTLPSGNTNWPAFGHVWHKLQEAAHYLAGQKYLWLNDDHVRVMAVMATGHEETMKAQLAICYAYGWAKP